MRKIALPFVCLCLSACATPARLEPPPLDAALEARLAEWMSANGRPPVEYVKGLFRSHDVVFLGEYHRISHDPVLVQSLLAPLYEEGVRRLAFEFARREDQGMIDTLLASPSWEPRLAREIVFREFVAWGYVEYVEVLRAAWNLNRSLPAGAMPFRVLGMNDSPDWGQVRSAADLANPEVVRRVWGDSSERHWAKVILDAVGSGEKVLVYSGIHHAFTRYRQPIVAEGEFQGFSGELRCGNYVHDAIGDRAVTVFLHAPWTGLSGYDGPLVHPADGTIDRLMLATGPRPVGFDVATGPFGDLPARNAVYANGYPSFRLADFCDGWIYTMPICEYRGVATVDRWVNADNRERAREQFPNAAFRKASAAILNRAIARDADIPRRFRHLR